MKKNAVNIIVALSLLCVIGVLVFQGMWLNDSLITSHKQFNNAVKTAMNNAVEAYEKRYVFTHFQDKFITDSTDKSEVRILIRKSDTTGVNILRIDSLTRINGINDTFKYYTRNEHNMVFVGDTFNYRLKDRVNNIVGQIIEEIKMDTLPFRMSLKPEGMDSLLTEALLVQGIDVNFEYAVEGPNGVLFQKSDAFNEGDTGHIYRLQMFPLRITHHPDVLLLQIPERHKAHTVFMSILPILIGSIVFTLFIIITFWLTIRTILKQKKISSIKNDFINNMTHEFKTPIATIGIAADAMKTGALNVEQVGHFADIIKQESQNMNQKVETILQMALLEQQQIKLGLKITDAQKLLSNAQQHLALQLEKSHATLTTNYSATQTNILADEMHLTNVFANIIDNAIKYASGPPQITINTRNTGNFLAIEIGDLGIGMTKEEQKHVFDKFYRAQNGNIHNTKGFGLGLSYAFEIIVLHKGSIEIESEKHKGTTVIIKLPLQND